MNPDENEMGCNAVETDTSQRGYGIEVTPDAGNIVSKWPDLLTADLSQLTRLDAVDQIHTSINSLIERTVSPEGFIPDTYQLVIGGETVTVNRVVAAQFFNLMFIDATAKDRRKAISDFTIAIKRCYGGFFPPMIGSELTQLTMDIDTIHLTLTLAWEYTKNNDENSRKITLPQLERFKTIAHVADMSEMQRLIWLLGQATGQEIRHDGVLPVFTVNIRPIDNKITVAKLNVSTKD